MNLKPQNRYILLTEILKTKEDDKPTILLPEEYTVKVKPYGVYQIQNISTECTKLNEGDIGKLVVVNNSMIEIINIDQGEFIVVLENYIYGVLEG